jgi:Na+-translocating ferredoxin:NAD+ oxidoreductase RnfC subunit
MNPIISELEQGDPTGISERLQAAGVAGAGGAGFPSYVKWQTPDDVDYLLVNHQESEPNYYADKWLGDEYAAELDELFDALLSSVFDAIIVGTKEKYRDVWTDRLEEATDATVYSQGDLPLDTDALSGVSIAYTPNTYTYSEESVLLMVTAGVQLGDDLPTDRGWIVHNTESLLNIYRALAEGEPVTRTYVHVDGDTPQHRCLDVPIGTPATELLKAAGLPDGSIGPDQVMADGGPGWCYRIDLSPAEFGVRKRTNGVLVLDEGVAESHTQEDGEIDVLDDLDWGGDHETEPTKLDPDEVRIPLITNAAYEGFVAPSEPVVDVGDSVSVGEVVARPAPDSISNTQHASIPGVVAEITDTHVVIERE